MKTKLLYPLLACILLCGAAFAQKATIVATEGKYIERVNDQWGDWPDQWTEYSDYPVIYITEMNRGSYGDIYNIILYMAGEELIDTNVTFDAEESTRIRKAWDNQYVNCYKDESGDYIYTVNISLESLLENENAWKTTTDAKIYMWAFSSDMGIVMKY